MTKNTYEAIRKSYRYLIKDDSDTEEVLCFVQSLLEAEAKHLKKTEPAAVNSIRRLEEAAREIGYLNLSLNEEAWFNA